SARFSTLRTLGPTERSFWRSSRKNRRISSATQVTERLVPIGEVVTTHGLDGWLKLNPFNPETTVLSSAQGVFLEKEGHRSAYGLEASTPHKRQFLVKLRDVNAIDAAEKCVGAILYADEAALHSLQGGDSYTSGAVGHIV